MTPLLWLLGAAVAGAASYLVGWPALSASRGRGQRNLNAERYLAWRGRAPRGAGRPSDGMTADERRRIGVGIGLAAIAAACILTFFLVS